VTQLIWRDGLPYSETYDDIYHARAGAYAQAEAVFISGNDIIARAQALGPDDEFQILETGFGLGSNFLQTCLAWSHSTQARLCFTSIEKHPLASSDYQQAHQLFPNQDFLNSLLEKLDLRLTDTLIHLNSQLSLRYLHADVLWALSKISSGSIEVLYLDGFAPSKNPHMWSLPVCQELFRVAKPQASLATWCVASLVRQNLSEAGFVVQKVAGFADKKEMLTGIKP